MPRGGEGKYKHEVIESKTSFDNRSFRVKTINECIKLTIGCPNSPDGKSNWMPRKKRCKVGTRAQKKMILKTKKCLKYRK